jgi:hypothetical protein
MACVICGNPSTIEAHILPRALYRRLADNDQHAFQGSLFKRGTRFQAKGTFDPDLLCATHEAMLGTADDYGLRFLHGFETKGRLAMRDNVWLVPNPKPDLLVRFVAACIWRRGVSTIGREHSDLDLGGAEPRLRAMLFEGETRYQPALMVIRRTYTSQGQHLREIMWEPCKGYGFGDNTWSFLALGCEFMLKLNPYSHPPFPAPFVANGKREVWAMNMDPQEFIDVPGAVDIAVNMLRDRERPRT